MFQAIRQKALRAKTPLLALLAFGLLGLAAIAGPDLLTFFKGPDALYPDGGLDPDTLNGRYLAGDIDYIFDWYAETVQTDKNDVERTTAREYLVPLFDKNGDAFYIGVEVPASLMDDAEAVLADTENWLLDPDSYVWDGSLLSVRGTVHSMDAETEKMYYEVLETFGMDDSDRSMFLPLVLTHGDVGSTNQGSLLGLFAVLLGLALVFVWVLTGALTGRSLKPLRRYLALQPDPAAAEYELDLLYESDAPGGDPLMTNSRWLLYVKGSSAFAAAVPDIAWVYQTTTQHRVNGIPSGKTYAVMVCTASEDKKWRRHTIPVRTEADARAVMERIARLAPDAVYGYNAAWDASFNADPAEFLRRMQAARRAAQPSQAGPAAAAPAAQPATPGSGPAAPMVP